MIDLRETGENNGNFASKFRTARFAGFDALRYKFLNGFKR